MIVRMTDSPAAYSAVVINIDSVTVHISTQDSLSGWYTISTVPASYDLLQLANGADTVIAGAAIPSGTYSQIRLHIGIGSYVVVDSGQFPLTIPSGQESGLKLNVHATLVPNTTYTLLLDFDAERSITVTGGGEYILQPVIRVVTSGTSTGNISGSIEPVVPGTAIWGLNEVDTVATHASSLGEFRLAYLPPGVYTVSITPGDPAYRDTTLPNIAVTAGQTTSLGTIVLTPN
jgi:hypothetical protein